MTRNRILAGLTAVMMMTAGCAGHTPPPASASAAAIEDRMVDIRGVPLHFRLYPGGARTILLESGSGLGADTWKEVAPRMAQATGATIIAYDRAGMGISPGLSTPYDIHEEIGRLHAGLYALGRDHHLTLVGHSYGGYLIQLYANLYPGDVEAMVYVDANTVTGIDGIGGAATLAEGRIKANDVPDPTPYQLANLRLSRGLARTQETMRAYPPVCGIPVAVITAGKVWPGTAESVVEGWRSGHRELAALTGGRAVMADGAGHMVHTEQPDIVVSTVADTHRSGKDKSAYLGVPGAACKK